MVAVLKPITARVIQRPAYVFASSFDGWFELNRAAVADYAYELAMTQIDEDGEAVGLETFARCQYDIERAARGLPLHVIG